MMIDARAAYETTCRSHFGKLKRSYATRQEAEKALERTYWGAYNAVADYADHHAATRGENKASRMFERTFEDSDLKNRALELILAA